MKILIIIKNSNVPKVHRHIHDTIFQDGSKIKDYEYITEKTNNGTKMIYRNYFDAVIRIINKDNPIPMSFPIMYLKKGLSDEKRIKTIYV